MFHISLRDLQWRRRRFTIAILAAALAFGLALVMSGTDHSLKQEGVRTVRMFSSDQWLVADDVSGPFTTSQLLPETIIDQVSNQPGVEWASPMLLGRTVRIGGLDLRHATSASTRDSVGVVWWAVSATTVPRPVSG